MTLTQDLLIAIKRFVSEKSLSEWKPPMKFDINILECTWEFLQYNLKTSELQAVKIIMENLLALDNKMIIYVVEIHDIGFSYWNWPLETIQKHNEFGQSWWQKFF